MTENKYWQTLEKLLTEAKEKYRKNEEQGKRVLRQKLSLEENYTVIISNMNHIRK